MPTPLFILGKQRSGTTWLANQLCQHPEVAGITHELHDGIHESAFFSDVAGRYGDIENRSNFLEFVQVLAASDYYRLTGLPKSFLLSLWGRSYAEVFRAIMDAYAVEHGASYWLEKSPEHTLMANELASYYPDARFVAVIRDPESTVASMLAFKRHEWSQTRRKQQIARSALGWLLFRRTIRHFAANSGRLLVVNYERMLTDLPAVMAEVCSFLELGFSRELLTQRFEPNSSFAGDDSARSRSLSASERALVRSIITVGNALPGRLLATLRPVNTGSRRRALPSWFFSMTRLHDAGTEAAPVQREAPVDEATHVDEATPRTYRLRPE